MKSPKKNGIGEVVTEYGTRVMKVIKKGLLGRSLFDFYGDIKAQAFKTKEMASVPSTPADGKGGVIYTKSADGKLYYKSNEVAEVELSASDTVLTSEQVQDIVGGMLVGTETRIGVTYDDTNGRIDFVVDDMTADTNTQNTTTLSFVDSSDDILLRNTTGGAGSGTDDIKFVAGSNITLTHTDADNITIASTDTNTTYSEATGSAEGLMSIAHHDKLDGIEASADVTDTTNVTAAGALMDSELTDLAGVKGVTISTLQVKPSEGAFANGDKTKLDGIEAGATADQTQADINGLGITAIGIASVTDGDVTITSDGHVTVKLDADNDESNQRFKITDNSDATVFFVQEDGNVLLTGTIITNSGSDNDLTLETDGSLTFTIDRDNDETSQKFSFVNFNAEVASIDEAGNLQIDGDLTVDGNNITNNASATNFNISSSRILELQHAGSYDIQLGSSTNADVLRVAGDAEIVTVNGELRVNGDSVTFESANADDPIFTLKNTNNGTNDPAQMIFIKDRGAAPAVGTNLGEVRFQGEDSNQNSQEYGGFLCEIDVATDGQESGQFGIWVATHDGELKYGLQLTGGDAEDKVNVAIGQGAASLTTIAGDLQVNGNDIKDSSGNANTLPGVAGTLQHQGEKTGQYLQIKIKDLNSYMVYMYNDDYWYSAGSGTLAILGLSTAPSAISSANSEYQSRTACYTAIADCTVKKLQLTFYWSSSVVSAADIDFAFSKFTPITDGTAADITMNAITATDHNGSYTENKPYQKTFTFSGGNASLSAGDALGFHMRTTGGSSAQRIFIYGTAILSVELD